MLWRIRDYIPHETKILYYNFCFAIARLLCKCMGTYQPNSFRLYLQTAERIVCIISDVHASNIDILFQRLNIMTIYERMKFQTILLVRTCLNGMTSDYLQGLIKYAGLIHGYMQNYCAKVFVTLDLIHGTSCHESQIIS